MKKLYTAAAALLLAVTGATAAESVPYTHVFDVAGSLDGWTVPANSDFEAFQFRTGYWGGTLLYNGAGSRCMSSASGSNFKDSWLISPSVTLEAGREYRVTYTYAVETGYMNHVGVFYGNAADKTAMSNPALEGDGYTILPMGSGFLADENYRTLEATITPSATGDYFIGFHDKSEKASAGRILITKVTVATAAAGGAPAEATEFTVTPDATGLLSVSLSAKAPSVDASGNALTSITSLDFIRNGEVIETVSNPTPGQTYPYVDNNPRNGNNTYGVQSHNAEGSSNVVSETVKVGVDAPGKLTNVTAVESTPGHVHLTWALPERDEKGYLLNPDRVTVKINVYQGSNLVKTVENITGTETTIEVNDGTTGGTYRFELFAVTTGGESIPVESGDVVLVGKAATVPYFENFAGGVATNVFEKSDNENLTANWQIKEVSGTGVAQFYGNGTGAKATLYSGLIELPEGERNSISFKYSGYMNNSEMKLTLLINDGENWNEVKTYTATTADWQTATEDLSAYAGKTIRYGLRAELRQGYYLMVTDIKIGEGAARDLGFDAVEIPGSVERCITAEGKVTVKNYGTEAVDAYTVELYRNDERIATKDGSALAAGATEEFIFDIETEVESLDQYTFYAVINYAADENTSNNTSGRTVVHLTIPDLAPATNVRAEMNEDKSVVTLKWDQPEGAEAGSKSPWRNLYGYQVVRDGVATSTELVTECEFVDSELEAGTYEYTVVAVYAKGQAPASEAVTAEVVKSGIETVGVDALNDAVYFDLQGRRVANPAAGMLLIKVANGEATRVLVK